MSGTKSNRLLHLTLDGGSLMSHTDIDVLTTYGKSRGWISEDGHGTHYGSGVRITDKPDYIRETFCVVGPDDVPVTQLRENTDLAWHDAAVALRQPPQERSSQHLMAKGYRLQVIQTDQR